MAVLHSVVVPVYNEEEGIRAFHERCSAAMAAIGDEYEIVYVDDGSRDASWAILAEFAEANPHVRLLRFSRNFGHQVAITAGIDHASGDTVTVIDSDLQDPPEVIAEFVERWRAGADIVYGVRTVRQGETAFKRASASIFYRLLGVLSDVEIPVDAGDFRLLSREAADALRSMPEHHRYVRGLVAWLGFVAEGVPYVREPRVAGETKYPLGKMVRFALDGIMAFSMRPLRLAMWFGMFISVAAFVTGIGVIIYRLAGGEVVQGWASATVLMLFLAGVQLMTIGVLGEYVGRVYSEVRARPLYLLRDMRGFSGRSLGRTRAAHTRDEEDTGGR
ncbi:MAG: glycosyltransferase family 2 protein [Coriobacteriia bacterium]|nr:glycosyltransferase family 2 protein [Coriobacteriia bacterium]